MTLLALVVAIAAPFVVQYLWLKPKFDALERELRELSDETHRIMRLPDADD